MKTTLATFGGLMLAICGVGCQCCGVTERYADLIDDVADYQPCLDRYYRAELDLNRIGKPDWCCSRINRMLCPCHCQSGCGCGNHQACGTGSECNCPTPCQCGDAVSPAENGTAPVAPPAPEKHSTEEINSDVPYLSPAGE